MLNLTPHAIVVMNDEAEEITSFEPSGTIARVTTSEKEVGVWNYDGDYIAIVVGEKGEVTGLPEDKDTQFLVSGMVLDALGPEYHNIAFAPDTGATAVRDTQGRIIGVTRLRTVAK